MRAIEFYTTPSGEVTIKEQGQPERQLKESDTDFIQSFLEILEEFYPEAYAALRKYYARYDGNKCYRAKSSTGWKTCISATGSIRLLNESLT